VHGHVAVRLMILAVGSCAPESVITFVVVYVASSVPTEHIPPTTTHNYGLDASDMQTSKQQVLACKSGAMCVSIESHVSWNALFDAIYDEFHGMGCWSMACCTQILVGCRQAHASACRSHTQTCRTIRTRCGVVNCCYVVDIESIIINYL
jgi:hypothetical protein